jgi:hypothetical protein
MNHQHDIDSCANGVPRWLIVASIGLISLACGAAGGFVFGYLKGKSDDKSAIIGAKELANLNAERAEAAEAKASSVALKLVESSLAIESLKLEFGLAKNDWESKLAAARAREERALEVAKKAESQLSANRAAEQAVVARQREEVQWSEEDWKHAETVEISSVKDALALDENPEKYLGKKVLISSDIAFVIGRNFSRNAESDGFLFTWLCGSTASGAESMGSSFTLRRKGLNYWCSTDLGLWAKEGLKDKNFGGNPFFEQNHSGSLKFKIFSRRIGDAGSAKEYCIAELVELTPRS